MKALQIRRKDHKREFSDKMRKCFYVNSNPFAALIGRLTTAVCVINMTIQLERWVLVVPTADRTLQLGRERWSRK